MLCFISFCFSDAGLSLFKVFNPLSFSSCHPLFLCCHSRLLSFSIPLLVLIAVFLTAVVFLSSKGIIYQSPQLFHFLIPPRWYLLFHYTEIHHLVPPATWLSMSLAPSNPASVPSTLQVLQFSLLAVV